MNDIKKSAVIIGAGPAGLTAGLELAKTRKFNVTLIEKDAVVGGISKTTEFKKCFFDIGPHHFITDSAKILAWWQDIMQGDFHKHKRYTRIYYKKHFFNYPLQPFNVIRGLSLKECIQSVFSYIRIRFFPIKNVCSFQDWVTNKFGSRLFSIFFKTYTEKVWGISCQELSADWSAQRIKGFSLSKAIFYAFFGRFFIKNKPRTLSDVFYYPSLGAGVLWENVAARIATYEGSSLYLNSPIVSLEHDGKKIVAAYSKEHNPIGGAAVLKRHDADYFLSTMPLRDLILALDPLPAEHIIKAAQSLRYRGLVTINLIVNKSYVSPDHWLYIHEKDVRMGRVGNMNNFSLKMVDNSDKHTGLCLEYFSFIDEEFWNKTDYELVEIGKRELEKIGLVKAAAVIDGMVVRTPDAYPMYVGAYKDHLDVVLGYLKQFSNIQLMGRNGMHSYNNMDTAMITAMDAVDTVLAQEHVKVREKVSGADVFLT